MSYHHSDEIAAMYPDLGPYPKPDIDPDRLFVAACGASDRFDNFAALGMVPGCERCQPARDAWREALSWRVARMLLDEAEAIEPGMWRAVYVRIPSPEYAGGQPSGPAAVRDGGRVRLKTCGPGRRSVSALHYLGSTTGYGDTAAEAIADCRRKLALHRQTMAMTLQAIDGLWGGT